MSFVHFAFQQIRRTFQRSTYSSVHRALVKPFATLVAPWPNGLPSAISCLVLLNLVKTIHMLQLTVALLTFQCTHCTQPITGERKKKERKREKEKNSNCCHLLFLLSFFLSCLFSLLARSLPSCQSTKLYVYMLKCF